MRTSRDDLGNWLKGASEVPWSKDLEERIVRQAEAMLEDNPGATTMSSGSAQRRRTKRRRRDLRSWLAVLGGVAAAVLVAVAVWNTGTQQQLPTDPLINTTTSGALPVHQEQTAMAQNTIGLRSAPIEVRGLGLASSTPGGPLDEVVATLVNTGNKPISKPDVFGVLSFHNSSVSTSAVLQSVDWITFVGAPNQTLMPGQSAVWTFQPTTAPTDGHNNLTDTPSLQFYWAGTASGNAVTATWHISPVQIAIQGVDIRSTWTTGEAFGVRTTIRNTSHSPLHWSKMLAIIWFDNSSQFGFTEPGVSRYFSTIPSLTGSSNTLNPGATVPLTFRLVGPVDPTLTSQQPHVLLIQEGTN